MAKRTVLPVGILTLITLAAALIWYNSSQQRLQGCLKTERDYYLSTSEGQQMHRRGSDPPVTLFVIECNEMGVK